MRVPQARALGFARVSLFGEERLCSGQVSQEISQAGVKSGGSQGHGGDPPKKCRQKYLVLANSLVANETSRQPCPNKAFAGGEAAAGEVSLFVPLFENHHFKKNVPDRAAFASLLLTTAKPASLPLQSCSISCFPFISSSLQGHYCSGVGFMK